MPDEDEYPTARELQRIRNCPVMDKAEWFEAVRAAWSHAYGQMSTDGRRVELVTGGWSGNEEVIGVMHECPALWLMTWVMSRRGGYYEFELERGDSEEGGE